MMIRLLLILLAFYPYTVSLSASDLERGHSYTATISAPEGSALALSGPAWLEIGPITYLGGETYQARVTVAPDAPGAYDRLWLLVDGQKQSSAPIRVGAPQVARVWLPLVGR